MAVSDNPLQRSTIQVQARDPGIAYQAPATNSALQLAGALSKAEPAIDNALLVYGQVEKQNQSELARKAAIENNGAELADAVRDGKIAPTQNPFFVQAYNTQAAAVRSRGQLSQLQVDSATWAEKNDPQAFQARWAKEVSSIGEGYVGKDAAAGFSPVAAQFTQQALATNTAQNVQRIEAEQVVNSGALLATDLTKIAAAKAGNPTADDVLGSIQAGRATWVGTGGSEEGWRKSVINAVTTAAYQTQNPGLLDLLKDPKLAGGKDGDPSLYSQPGVADQIEKTRYDITRAANAASGSRIAGLAQADVVAGQTAYSAMLNDPVIGNQLLRRSYASDDIIQHLSGQVDPTTGKPYTNGAIRAAIKFAGDAAGDGASLDRASISSPQKASAIVALQSDFLNNPSPQNQKRLDDMVASGDISLGEALSLQSTAHTLQRQAASDARADARQERSDARQAASDARRDAKDQTAAVAAGRARALTYGATAAAAVAGIRSRGPGKGLGVADPAMVAQAKQLAGAAYANAINQGGTPQAAMLEAHDAVQRWGHSKLGGARSTTTGSAARAVGSSN